MFIGVVFSTHLLLRDSRQKEMDDRLVLFAAAVAQSKLSKLCRLLSRISPRIDLRKTKGRAEIFPFINVDCGQRLWTMDWHWSVRTHIKISRLKFQKKMANVQNILKIRFFRVYFSMSKI